MPTFAVVAAGSSPRSRSSARARMARSRAAAGVSGSSGTPAPTCSTRTRQQPRVAVEGRVERARVLGSELGVGEHVGGAVVAVVARPAGR